MFAAMWLIFWAPRALADNFSVETVLKDLSRASGVAVRPGGTTERYEVFVAESGSRRIIRLSSSEPKRASDAITGFPTSSGGPYGGAIDSLSGILFLDENHLVASVTGVPPVLRLYQLTQTDASISADQVKQQVAPELPAENTEAALGMCLGLVRTRANDYVDDMLFVGIRNGRPVRGVWKVPIRANMLGTMTEFEVKAGLQASQPTPLTVSEQGYVLAIDASGRSGKGQLMFLKPTKGQVVLSFSTDFRGISDMAYSPKSGNLFVVARAHANKEGGLFRIDNASKPDERQIAIAKLADIELPTAMAFAPDGALYVTTLGDDAEDDGGALLKVTGNF
jgi:hypothetical protein